MNKKGMYFTLVTIAFLFIFIFVFMIPSYKRLGEKMTVIEIRVDSMNDFIKALKRDTERGLYISSFRALLALEQHIINHGEFLNDVELSFEEAVLNGTVNKTNSSLMYLSTFPLWIAKIREEANDFNIDANITLHNVNVYQNDPWYVGVSANLTFSIRDITGIASWKIDEVINTSVGIVSFEDPFYVVYSYGRITNLIIMTPFENNYTSKVGENWNVDNLLNHTENSYYAFNPNAPSFLTRLEGDFTPSPCCGIESLVNLPELADMGLDVCTDCSIVDHHYWDEDENGDYRINFTPSWYRIDSAHRAKYNVTQVSYLS